jgi:PAS domain S-box-containing protein
MPKNLDDVLERLREYVVSFDNIGNITYANKTFADIIASTNRLSPSDNIVGKNLWKLFPQLVETSLYKNIIEAVNSKEVRSVEWKSVFSDRFWETTIFPSDVGVIAIGRDITKRKEAEDTLRDSEERFRSVLNNSLDVIYRFNLQSGRYDYMSPAIRNMGFEPEEMTSMTNAEVLSRVHPDDLPAVQTALARLNKKGRATSVYRFKGKDGIYRWWSNQLVITKDSEGKPLYRDGYVRDVTEQKEAEQATKESEEKFRRAFETSPDACYIGTLEDGVIIEVNDAFLRVSGYSREECIGKTSLELGLYAKGAPDRQRMIAEIKSHGHFSNLEFDAKRKNGEVLTVLFSGTILEIKGKKLTYGILKDITIQKKWEKELEKHQRNLEKLVEERTEKLERSSLYARNLIEASLDPLVTISVEGKITDVNKATELVTGFSRELLVGSDFSDYFAEPQKAQAGYKQVFAEGIVRDYPLAIKHKSGKITDVLYNATVYRNETDEILGVFAAARDVTELKKAEAQTQEAVRKLKDSERLAAIGATAGMVGHDIRNPLQAIAGDLYLIDNDAASLHDGETKRSLQESVISIQGNLQYIDKIIVDLQDYAKRLNPCLEKINLEKIIEEVMLLIPVADTLKVVIEVENGFPDFISDFSMVKRILFNLVNNAVQAMPKEGTLTIRAFSNSGKVFVCVEDTGVGIPEDIKPKLFMPMITTKSKGQGFGLAVVNRFVEALNGTITFESQEGRGTKFIVGLPINKASKQ